MTGRKKNRMEHVGLKLESLKIPDLWSNGNPGENKTSLTMKMRKVLFWSSAQSMKNNGLLAVLPNSDLFWHQDLLSEHLTTCTGWREHMKKRRWCIVGQVILAAIMIVPCSVVFTLKWQWMIAAASLLWFLRLGIIPSLIRPLWQVSLTSLGQYSRLSDVIVKFTKFYVLKSTGLHLQPPRSQQVSVECQLVCPLRSVWLILKLLPFLQKVSMLMNLTVMMLTF